ncbi:MAG: hypothetical protein QM765_20645 [Myxococcales bacterium]
MKATPLSVCALAALLALPAAARAADRYEMEDLEVLDKQGAWDELAEHLTDIRPSKRDAKWLGIAERTVLGQLAATELNEHTAAQVLSNLKTALSRYPALKQSKTFMAARGELGLKAFAYTARNHRSQEQHEWVQQIREFVLADSLTPDLAQRAARKIQEQFITAVAWPLWKLALDRGANLCKDPDFSKALVENFLGGNWTEEVTPLVQSTCWNDVKPAVTTGLEKTDYGQLERLCPFLKTKKINFAKCATLQ